MIERQLASGPDHGDGDGSELTSMSLVRQTGSMRPRRPALARLQRMAE